MPIVLKKLGTAIYFGFVTFLASEAIVLSLLSLVITRNSGWAVLAAITILPLWGLLIVLVHSAEKPWIASLYLWIFVILFCLYFFVVK